MTLTFWRLRLVSVANLEKRQLKIKNIFKYILKSSGKKFIKSERKRNDSNFLNSNSQVPDVPELAHQGIFQLSQLRMTCYAKTVKIFLLY